MAITFNPLTGEFDITGAGGGSSSQSIFKYVVVDGVTITADTITTELILNLGVGLSSSVTGKTITIDGTTTAGSGIDSETAQDIVGAMITGGSGIVSTYNDTAGTLSLTADPAGIDHNLLLNYTTTQHFLLSQISITSAQISDLTETVEDIVAGEITAGSNKITTSYNDTDGTFAIDVDQTNIDHNLLLNYTTTQHFTIAQISITASQVSDFTESAQDFVLGAITAASNKISVNYTDTSNFLALDVVQTNIDHNLLLNYTTTQHFTIAQISIASSQISDLTETVEDIAAGWLTVGSTKLTGTYNDTDGTYSLDIGTLNLDHLADVSISGAATGQFLVFTTTGWVNASVASGSGGMSGPNSSTANAISYFNTTTGNTLAAQNSLLVTSTGLYLATTSVRLFFLTSTHYLCADAATSVILNSANTLTCAGQSTTVIGVAGDIILGDSTLRAIYPNSDGKIDLGKATNAFNQLFLESTVGQYNAIATIANGVPSEYATVDLTTQGAAIAATTLYAVPASGAGTYRVSWVATVTRAATTSSILGGSGGFQIVYTDSDDSVVKTMPGTIVTGVGTNATNSTSTGTISGSYVCRAKASTNIQYQIGYTSVGVTTMQFNLHIICEAL